MSYYLETVGTIKKRRFYKGILWTLSLSCFHLLISNNSTIFEGDKFNLLCVTSYRDQIQIFTDGV